MLRIVFIVSFFIYDTFAAKLNASDIDMSPAISDISLVVLAILNIIILLFAHRKVLSMLGN